MSFLCVTEGSLLNNSSTMRFWISGLNLSPLTVTFFSSLRTSYS